MARSTEQGSRQLIWASIGGKDNIEQLRGAYISSMQVREPSDSVVGEKGKLAQNKLWVSNNHLSYYRITDAYICYQDALIDELMKKDPPVKEIVEKYITPIKQ